jgi:hypothetical protein
VIQRSIADSTLKRGDMLRPNPTPRRVDPHRPLQSDIPVSADVYYGVDGKAAQAGQPRAGLPVDANVGPIVVREESRVRAALAKAIERVQMGDTQVKVGLGDAKWTSKARTLVEFAVAREEITEDQGREIILGVAAPAPAPSPKPRPPVQAAEPGEMLSVLGDPTHFVGREEEAVEAPKTPMSYKEFERELQAAGVKVPAPAPDPLTEKQQEVVAALEKPFTPAEKAKVQGKKDKKHAAGKPAVPQRAVPVAPVAVSEVKVEIEADADDSD